MVRPRSEGAPPPRPPPPPPGPRMPPPPQIAGLDPNQTYILSGPYMRVDEQSGMVVTVFAARPVPPGLTVIATPKPLVPVSAPAPPAPTFNPEAPPFYPKSGPESAKWNPCFLVFNPQCPEGKLMPLRQPQPPVYFQQGPKEV